MIGLLNLAIDLEDYKDKNYSEVKAKLELLGVNVLVEKKDVEDKEKYKGKENIIIDQKPAYNSEEKTLIKENDTITLYIPNIVNEYPDMQGEGWSLNDVISFTEEYKINLTVQDKDGKTIPKDKYNEFGSALIIFQSRPAEDTIIEGVTLKVKIEASYITEEPEPSSSSE